MDRHQNKVSLGTLSGWNYVLGELQNAHGGWKWDFKSFYSRGNTAESRDFKSPYSRGTMVTLIGRKVIAPVFSKGSSVRSELNAIPGPRPRGSGHLS